MNIEKRVEIAREAHADGYNCVQSVIMGYIDLFDADKQEIMKLSMGLGRGIGGSQEICGTVLGGAIIISQKYGKGISDRAHKHFVEKKINEFIEEFKSIHGSVICGELLGVRKVDYEVLKKPCRDMVEEVVRLLDKYLEE